MNTKVQPNQPQTTLQNTNEGISWKPSNYGYAMHTDWKITKQNHKSKLKIQHPYMKSKYVVRV